MVTNFIYSSKVRKKSFPTMDSKFKSDIPEFVASRRVELHSLLGNLRSIYQRNLKKSMLDVQIPSHTSTGKNEIYSRDTITIIHLRFTS